MPKPALRAIAALGAAIALLMACARASARACAAGPRTQVTPDELPVAEPTDAETVALARDGSSTSSS